jgi:trehalose 6-phosphate phosphatase
MADEVASAQRVLLVTDFDGTLAPRVDHPDQARVVPGALAALEALAASGITTAILSGRGRDDLAAKVGKRDRVLMIGSFGIETADGSPVLRPEQIALRQVVRSLVVRVLEDFRPAWMECKPLGAAAHLRCLRPDVRAEAHATLAATVAEREGLFVRHEAHTAEVMIMPASKQDALTRLRDRTQSELCVYAGDDYSDAEVGEALGFRDWFVMVGNFIESVSGPARVMRCAAPEQFARLLEFLSVRRLNAKS